LKIRYAGSYYVRAGSPALKRRRPLTNADGNSNYRKAINVIEFQHIIFYILITGFNIAAKKKKARPEGYFKKRRLVFIRFPGYFAKGVKKITR